MNYDPALFVKTIQSVLAEPLCFDSHTDYLDIAATCAVDDDLLQRSAQHLPPADPLVKALGLLLDTMKRGPFDLTRLGLNELFKAYLRNVGEENQEACARAFLNCIHQVYLYGVLADYPFTDLLWEYLSRCFDTTSQYLVNHRLVEACQVFLSIVSTMGKTAAQKGLHTSSIQHFLHNLEMRAKEEGFTELAASARNHRFSLETF